MSNKLYFGKEARKEIYEGVKIANKAISSTMGPGGRNYQYIKDGELRTTKDGVTVANDINLENPRQWIGAELIKKASGETAKNAGDGTTTSALLSYNIIRNSMNKVNNGYNVTKLRNELKESSIEVCSLLDKLSIPVKEENLEQVATISGNNNQLIGKYIKRATDKVGHDGVITLESSRDGETKLEKVEGIQFNTGYIDMDFVNTNTNMSSTFENPYILVYDGKISNHEDLLGLLEFVSIEQRSLLIVAEDVTGGALTILKKNKEIGSISACVVKAPEVVEHKRKQVLQDIALITGATVISPHSEYNLKDFHQDLLGECRRSVVFKNLSTIVDGKGDRESLKNRLLELKKLKDEATSDHEKEFLQTRISRFAGGVAIIHVGGLDATEINEKKDLFEDALHAMRASQKEGILPGGGKALLEVRKHMSTDTVGARIIHKALLSPFMKIMTNIGYDTLESYSLAEQVSEKDPWVSYNYENKKFENFLDIGIIDPTMVTRNAIENSTSVASTFLATEVVGINKTSDGK